MLNAHPYNTDKQGMFWRTAVAEINPETSTLSEIIPALPIQAHHKITSVGSCFAQYIGHWLQQHGYQYCQSKLLQHETASFALGNVYTPRALLQWLTFSDDELAQYSIYQHPVSQHFIDLLLPNLNPEGYHNKADLLEARKAVIEEIKYQLSHSDCFIFTLGLIEAWQDTLGICYPSCPGVKQGEYHADIYTLKVFQFSDILSDLTQLIEVVTSINPTIKCVLTVSPVPLTATATEQHVLVANSYAKAVLRAVAGQFCEQHAQVSYFPSFDLITMPGLKDFRYQQNRRTISSAGVNFVMSHWGQALGLDADSIDAVNIEASCDEEFNDAVLQQQQASQQGYIGLTLIGDSHLGKLAKAFARIDYPYCGGMVMNGSGFAQHKFMLVPEADIMVPLENAHSRQLWQSITANLHLAESTSSEDTCCVVTNIGLQTHQTVAMFIQWMKTHRPERLAGIEMEDFIDYFNTEQQDQLTIVLRLKQAGHRVIMVSDTPFWQHFEQSRPMSEIMRAYVDAMEYVCNQLGLVYFNAIRQFNEDIDEPMQYASSVVYDGGEVDYFHGADCYYDWLAAQLLPLIRG